MSDKILRKYWSRTKATEAQKKEIRIHQIVGGYKREGFQNHNKAVNKMAGLLIIKGGVK